MSSTELTFVADRSEELAYLMVGLAALLAGGLGAYYLTRRTDTIADYNRRMLVVMLLSFGALLGLGTALFSGWQWSRLGPVTVGPTEVELGAERFLLRDIQHASIRSADEVSPFDRSIVTRAHRILLITTRQGRTHALGENNYDVTAILRAIKIADESNR